MLQELTQWHLKFDYNEYRKFVIPSSSIVENLTGQQELKYIMQQNHHEWPTSSNGISHLPNSYLISYLSGQLSDIICNIQSLSTYVSFFIIDMNVFM